MRYQLLVAITFAALIILSATITMADIMEGLVAYWPLDEGSGTVAHDLSDNGHDGTLENGPAWTPPGEFKEGRGALAFDGTDDRIVVESFDVEGGSGITLAAWIKPASFNSDDARIISKAQGGGTEDHYWAMVMSGNGEDDLQFRLRTDAGAVSKITVPDGQELEAGVWIHVAVTWDASDPNMRFYKNGEEIHSASKPGTSVGAGPDVKIGVGNQSISAGADSMDRPFHGIMDDVAVWNRGLTQEEIAELIAVGIPSAAVEPNEKLMTEWGSIKQP
jgi:hypothetical protein